MKTKKIRLIVICTLFMFVLVGCGRNKLIEGTYVHQADENFDGEFIITHKGNNVAVIINGQEYESEMEDANVILVDGQYNILETYADSEGNPDIKNCVKDNILIPNAKTWIEGDYEVDKDGNLRLVLDKQ